MRKLERESLEERRTGVRDPRLCVIAVEGSDREPRYFNCIKADVLKNSNIIIETLPGDKATNLSAPNHVLERLKNYQKQYEVHTESGDTLWLVIDIDRWPKKNLEIVYDQCKKEGYTPIASNPYFEVWLCFHFEEAIDYPKETNFKQRLNQLYRQFDESDLWKNFSKSRILDAITRAKKTVNPEEKWPTWGRTQLYILAEYLISGTD